METIPPYWEALRKNRVTVQYMLKENEGHGFRNQENRFDFYNSMIELLNKNMSTKVKG